MCTVIEKYNHERNSYYIFDINRYPKEPEPKEIRNICREYNCQNLSGMLIGPFADSNGYYTKSYDTSGCVTEPSIDGMMVFNKYLIDKNYVCDVVSDNKAIQTGSVMLL